jgi:uncharacterized protein (DUF1684 family)
MRALALAAILLASCSTPRPVTSGEDDSWRIWREDRLTRLTAADGWLTLVGLYWIEPGTSTIGSDPASKVILPAGLPARLGTLDFKGSQAQFTPAPRVDLKPAVLKPEEDAIRLGTVSFYLIERGGRYGIRVKDSASAARKNFTGLEYFDYDPTWHVTAKLTPSPHEVVFDTEVGVKQHYQSPGYLEFDRNGTHYKVDAVTEEDELFLVLRDATSGKTTYGASRFLYAKQPDAQGNVQLNFNKAYNPPCVFSAFATCPLPPPQNRLTTPIEAGEKKYTGPVNSL